MAANFSHTHVALSQHTDAEKAVHVAPHQKWHFDSKTGFITGFDGRVLDVKGGSATAGAKLQVFPKKQGGTENQQWEYKDGFFHTKMGTNFVIDIYGGNVANGTDVILWPKKDKDNANQQWDIDHFGFIRSRANHAFGLDVSGGKPNPGAAGAVGLWTCAASPAQVEIARKLAMHQNQRFHWDAKTGFLTAFDGRVLDVEGGSAAAGAKLILWPKKDKDNLNQQWTFHDGFFTSKMGTNFVIDIYGGTFANSTELILWPKKDKDNNNQKWDIDAYGFIRSRGNPAFGMDVKGGAIPVNGMSKMQIFTLLHGAGGKL